MFEHHMFGYGFGGFMWIFWMFILVVIVWAVQIPPSVPVKCCFNAKNNLSK